MKLAITSMGTDLNAEVDPRFGRAAYILIVDTETSDFDVLDNKEIANSLKGAGIQASVKVSEQNAEVLLTGHCGPNAMKTLKAANIKVVNDVKGSLKDAIEAFKKGQYEYSTEANVEGHWV